MMMLVIFVATLLRAWGQSQATEAFVSGGHPVHYEVFRSAGADDPLLILLPGSSGPGPFYRAEAAFFAEHGYTTLLLHFFDAGESRYPSDKTYGLWANALADLVRVLGGEVGWQGRRVYVVGYSLGASVALAAGSQKLPVRAIAEWYGSLPDSFFLALQGMPPLLILHGARDSNIPVLNAQQLIRLCGLKSFECASHIYPDEGHGFSEAAAADARRRTLEFFAGHAGRLSSPLPVAGSANP